MDLESVDESEDNLTENGENGLSCSAPPCSSIPSSGKRSLSLDDSLGSSVQSLESAAPFDDVTKFEEVPHVNTPCDPRPLSVASVGTTSATASPKSLFSRLSKTLEDRIGKIRSERGKSHFPSHDSDLSHVSFIDDECISFSHLASESKNDELYSKVPDNSPSEAFIPAGPRIQPVETEPPEELRIKEKRLSSPSVFDIRFRHRKESRTFTGISLKPTLATKVPDVPSPSKSSSLDFLDSSIEHGVEAAEDTLLSILDGKSVHYSSMPERSHLPQKNSSGELPSESEKESDQQHSENSSIFWPVILSHRVPVIFQYYWRVSCGVAVFFICFVLPLPSFLSGMIFGLSLALIAMYGILSFFFTPPPSPPSEPGTEEPFEKQHQLSLSASPSHEDFNFKGWLNKLDGEYNPDEHHISKTHSVFVRIRGSQLLVDHPRKRIRKHAHFEEKLDSGGFVHHREYELTGASVLLEPDYLPRRWLWSRKYPICVRLRRTARVMVQPATASHHPTSVMPDEDEEDRGLATDDEDTPGAAACSAAEVDSFEHVTEDMCVEELLYFFARSDREKELWYRRLVSAAQDTSEATATSDDVFNSYMLRLMSPVFSAAPEVSWINILAGRLLYDFLHNPYWANKIQERIQRKLSKVHLPPLVGELVVCGVKVGHAVPQLLSVESPVRDSKGLWCDLSVQYDGNLTMTIETKIDLMKLKRADSTLSGGGSPSGATPDSAARHQRSCARFASHGVQFRELHFDTDTDDSVESSTDDEDAPPSSDVASVASDGSSPPGGGRRLMKLVDTLTGSRYFQQATDWGILRKAMKGVSNTRIVLSVRVEKLRGVLAVNIPPQPSDRIWYGFRERPELVMKAEPKLGEQPLSLPFLSNFLERQLRKVFEKIFVLPNMDDLVVPIMSPLLPGQSSLPKPPWETGDSSPSVHQVPLPGFESSTATTTPTTISTTPV